MQRLVGAGMLNRVTTFMRGDTQCSGSASEVIRFRQHQPLVQRIIVVAQHPIGVRDLDITDAGAPENFRRHFRAG